MLWCCQDPASLITAPERDGEGGISLRKEQSWRGWMASFVPGLRAPHVNPALPPCKGKPRITDRACIWTLSENELQIDLLALNQDISIDCQSWDGRKGAGPISPHAALCPSGSFVLLSSLDSRVRILGVFIYCQAEPLCDCGNTCRLIKLSREEFWKALLIQDLNLGWARAPQLSALLLDGILITADLPPPPAFSSSLPIS